MKAFVLKLEVGSTKAEVIVEENGEVSIIGVDARRQIKKTLLSFISCRLSDGVFTRTSRTVSGDVLECVRRVSSDEAIFPQVLCDAINEEQLDGGSVFAYVPDALVVEEPDLNIHSDLLRQVLKSGAMKRLGQMAFDGVGPFETQPRGSYDPNGAYVIKLPNLSLPQNVHWAQIEGSGCYGYAINNRAAVMAGRETEAAMASERVCACAC